MLPIPEKKKSPRFPCLLQLLFLRLCRPLPRTPLPSRPTMHQLPPPPPASSTSLVSRARTAIHSAAARAERVLTDIKADLRGTNGALMCPDSFPTPSLLGSGVRI